jgi:hypothetical protein
MSSWANPIDGINDRWTETSETCVLYPLIPSTIDKNVHAIVTHANSVPLANHW